MNRKKSNQDKRKKEQKKLEKMQTSDSVFHAKVITVLCVLLIFAIFYLLTVHLTGGESSFDAKEDSSSSFETILGRSFSMKNGEYAILYYDTSDQEVSSSCQAIFNDYQSIYGEGSIYYVDMNSGFNKAYQTEEESNKNPESVSELLIHGPTLIKFNENKVVDYIEGIEAIQESLNS